MKEAITSNPTIITKSVLNTIKAVDDAKAANKQLIADTDIEKLDVFKKRMSELQERLGTLKRILDNEQAYAMDELIDALSKAYTDHRPQYRRTPRMRE